MSLARSVLDGDPRAASRLLSLIEDGDDRAAAEMKEIYRRTGKSYILGVTGPPGAGKSTIVDHLVSRYRAAGLKVGVLAVDPTSPLSGGAVLGDRIRMQRHAADSGVFIRSMATRNWPGGLSRAAAEAARVLDAYGCGIVIIETVGVGQSEVGVADLAYTTVLVFTPAAGDKIQAIKAGVTEVADIVVLNKADLPGAEEAAKSLEMILSMESRGGRKVPLVSTVGRDGRGIDGLAEAIDAHRRQLERGGALEAKKREGVSRHLLALACAKLHDELRRRIPGGMELDSLAGKIMSGAADPYTLAEEIAGRLRGRADSGTPRATKGPSP